MTNYETGILMFRTLSIYALIRGVERTSYIIGAWPQGWPDEKESLLRQLIFYAQLFAPILIFIIFSLALWKVSPRLVSKMFARDQISSHPAFTISDAQSLVFAGFGLYLLVNTIPDLVQSLLSIYASVSMQLDSSTRTQVTILRITTVARLVVGCWFLFRAKELSNMLSKIRNE